MKIPTAYRRAIVSRLKIMANLDIAERRKPQEAIIGGNEEEKRLVSGNPEEH